MPQALDMRSVLFEGAFVCLMIAAIMAYHSIARRTYPGFHYWTCGFASVGGGAILIALRGTLPAFLSVVLANVLVVAMPFLLVRGLEVFLGVAGKRKMLAATVVGLFVAGLFWSTYVSPSLCARIVWFSLAFLWFLADALRVAVKHLPAALGKQNWLLVIMLGCAIVSTAFRLVMSALHARSLQFLNNTEAWQSGMILLTILSMVGIMASLIILNAQRMELELTEANRKIEILATRDGLTNLFNRRYFDKKLKQEFHRARRTGQPLSLILADIDFFKNYNDTYGHLAGDACIRSIAEALRDSGERIADIAARYGGEEFVLLLPDTDLPGAGQVARALSRRVQAKAIAHETSSAADTVTLSIGVATVIPGRAARPDSLLDLADQALYESKSSGRNRIRSRFFDAAKG